MIAWLRNQLEGLGVTTRIRLRIAVCLTCGSSVAARGPRQPRCPYCQPAPARWKLCLVAGIVAGIAAVLLSR